MNFNKSEYLITGEQKTNVEADEGLEIERTTSFKSAGFAAAGVETTSPLW